MSNKWATNEKVVKVGHKITAIIVVGVDKHATTTTATADVDVSSSVEAAVLHGWGDLKVDCLFVDAWNRIATP